MTSKIEPSALNTINSLIVGLIMGVALAFGLLIPYKQILTDEQAVQRVQELWKKYEPAIATNLHPSLYYTLYIISGPFSKDEAAIASDPQLPFLYVFLISKDRLPEGEEAIKGSERKDDYSILMKELGIDFRL